MSIDEQYAPVKHTKNCDICNLEPLLHNSKTSVDLVTLMIMFVAITLLLILFFFPESIVVGF